MTPRPGRPHRTPDIRSPADGGRPIDTLAPRWRGQRDRAEVWYATWTDPARGVACWVHHEMTAPVDGVAFAHGWTAVFGVGSGPALERFGPEPMGSPERGSSWASVTNAVLDPPALRGETGRLAWDVRIGDGDGPLFTFPAWAWDREALPAAQVLPVPSAPVTGAISIDTNEVELSSQTTGSLAHIYGHGSAERWGWLHADLGGGDVLEIVSAVSRRPGLDRLPPLAFVQLRLGGTDWPRDSLVAAPLFRTRLGLPTWDVRGTVGRWRLRVEVTIPPDRSVRVGYLDPDGATATCTNSEVSDTVIVLEHRRARWEMARRWELRGRAHAEIGTRP